MSRPQVIFILKSTLGVENFTMQPAVITFIFIFLCGMMWGCSHSYELEWNDEGEYKWAEISTGFFGNTGFKQLSSSNTGITFNNRVSRHEIAENRHYLNGSGVAAGDINGNGLVDLYFAGLNEGNRLYKNLGGMRFEDITEHAGVGHEGYYSTGAVFADINGNGHLDLLVTALHGENTLYINDGKGVFKKEENSGLGQAKGSNTMALADFTGNGYPDLYITNYKEISVKDLYSTRELDWQNILQEPLRNPEDHYTLIPPFDEHYELVRQQGALVGISELGREDDLYLNHRGIFERVTNTKEIFLDEHGKPFGLQPDWGLTSKFHDITGNGLQDLYVCNDFHTPDRIWLNQGDGTFRAAGWQAIRNLSYSCMSIDFSDINRNGKMDIFTTEMLDPVHDRRLRQAPSEGEIPITIGDLETRPMYNRNSLFIQREDTTWAETSWFSGVEATGWSWATRFMDVNLDGYEDLIVTTGYLYDILDIDAQFKMMQNRRNMDEHFIEFIDLVEPLNLQNKMLKNNHNLTFSDVSSDWGFEEKDVSHGMAFADLNNNGVLDIIVNRMNREAVIFENKTNALRIAVRLKGRSPNTRAIGASVELAGGSIDQKKQITAGGDYASGSDSQLMFAANGNKDNYTLNIRWPDGSYSVVESVQENRIYEIDQAKIDTINRDKKSEDQREEFPLFEKISEDVNYAHHEEPFNDFELQPLLPYRLSQLGPGMAWIDLDRNGSDELLMGSGRGGSLTILKFNGAEDFSLLNMEELTENSPGDQTAIIGWGEDDFTRVLVGSANYEQGTSNAPSVFHYRLFEDGTVIKDSIPGVLSTTGPLAAADVSENGYLDLFLGGNFKPGQYPADADSRFAVNDEGTFRFDQVNSETLSGLGLVTGAVFSDLSGNGSQDLLLATEWGSLRLFENSDGKLTEITEQVGLNKWSGWWKGVATGDFTNNGLPDIVASNIGMNSQYQLKNNRPIRLYYGDIDGFGGMDIIEAYASENGAYLPRHRLYKFQANQINLNKMGSHREFAGSTMKEILGDRYEQTPFKEINTLEHMIFINHGDYFEAIPLPTEAQLSAGFHIGVADFNNDGNEDIILTQNLFALPRDQSRMDAGRGLIMLGDGGGNFKPLSGTESGIRIYGEQRGAAMNDINKNGKIDLAVSQNGNEMKLYLNRSEKAGLRIILQGPLGNKNGVGSSMRLIYENGEHGPQREIQSGSGYWSQNSFTQVLGVGDNIVQEIEITWYDGAKQTADVVEGEINYIITHPEAID